MRESEIKLRKSVFRVIQPDSAGYRPSIIFDWIITSLIFLSVASVFIVTLDLPAAARRALIGFEAVASTVFTIEYVLRIWTASELYSERNPWIARCRYVASGMAIIDLLAILPFWLPMFLPESMLGMRAFRLVRLLRIFKLNRYFDALVMVGCVVREKRRELVGSMLLVMALMLVSSLLVYAAEHDAQPDAFRNAFSGLWWAVATLTTVGYGDIYPVTPIGRILGAVIALLGIGMVAIPTSILSSGFLTYMTKKRDKDDLLVGDGALSCVCPHCGKPILSQNDRQSVQTSVRNNRHL